MKTKSFILFLLIAPLISWAQSDSTQSKLEFNADFRFRVEQDWDSRKSDGSFRDDRTRLRYRLRAGMTYTDKWYRTGFQIRTGNPGKQQDPQLTLGEGFKEFGTLPLGFEKAYFEGKWKRFNFWLGKNTFPFEKSNELFWSDNVYPEGIFIGKGFLFKSSFIDSVAVNGGHFILSASGKSLYQDAYLQGFQTYGSFFKNRFEFFPSFYWFKNVAHVPDGYESFEMDYAIFHGGARINLLKNKQLALEFDFYYNLQDYSQNDSIATHLKEEKSGMVAGLKYGTLNKKGDWLFKGSYAYLQRYSAVDFMAQNDWARWDYSSFGSPDGRLTNLQGIELVAAYKIADRVKLTMKYYWVEQLISYGSATENGSRIRFDLDVNF